MSRNTETAILAGGCSWVMQQLLRQPDEVLSTRVRLSYTSEEQRREAGRFWKDPAEDQDHLHHFRT